MKQREPVLVEMQPGAEEGMDLQKDCNSVRRVWQKKGSIKKCWAEVNTAGNLIEQRRQETEAARSSDTPSHDVISQKMRIVL
jgi:hypothetical protein